MCIFFSFKVCIEFVTMLLLFYVLVFLAVRHVGCQLPEQGLNPHLLHWKVKSEPLDPQESPSMVYILTCCHYPSERWCQFIALESACCTIHWPRLAFAGLKEKNVEKLVAVCSTNTLVPETPAPSPTSISVLHALLLPIFQDPVSTLPLPGSGLL